MLLSSGRARAGWRWGAWVAVVVAASLMLSGLQVLSGWRAAAAAAQLRIPGTPIVGSSGATGYLSGTGEVTPDGQYAYSIPLDVPSGRAGMAPRLTLRYSGRGGDGPLGVGWSLWGAESRVTWCGESLSTEGTTGGVRLDGDDRLCLDGQKLIAVSGEYGATGTRYRTETNSFSEIISGPGLDDGPQNFTVRTKDGLERFYEGLRATRKEQWVGLLPTGPSEILTADDEQRVVWLLRSERDRSGNEIQFDHVNIGDPGAPEIVLKRVTYTHHAAEPAFRKVELEYENRPDASAGYMAGVRFVRAKRIKSIDMYAPNPSAMQLVWQYRIGYSSSPTGRSLLTSVAKCGASGGCLRAKTFGWDSQSRPVVPGFSQTDLGAVPVDVSSAVSPGVRVADINGDGASDAYYTLGGSAYEQTSVRLRMSVRNPSGALVALNDYRDTAQLSGWPASATLPRSRAVDLDVDGTDELVLQYPVGSPGGGVDQVVRWNGAQNRFDNTGQVFMSPSPSNFADVNGDGLPDYLTADVPQADDGQPEPPQDPENPQPPAPQIYNYSVRLNTGSGFAPPKASTLASTPGRSVVRVSELDDDGRAELLIGSYVVRADDAGNVTGQSGTMLANNQVWYRVPPLNGKVASYGNQYRLVDGDFNGDGLVDWLALPITGAPNGPWAYPAALFWNTGNGLALDDSPITVPHDAYADVQAADVDNDGRDDLVVFHSATTVMISKGDGQFVSWAVAGDGGIVDPQDGHSTSRLGDFNGDGRIDVLRITPGGRMVTLLQDPSYGNRITTVTDQGTAWAAQTVLYSTQWADKPTVPAPSCAYPQSCPRAGLVVVRRLDSRAELANPADPTKPARSIFYSYEDPRVDRRGRGVLGFGSVTSWDPDRPVQVTTTYDHNTRVDNRYYPYAGVPSTVTTATPILTQAQVAQHPSSVMARITRTVITREVRKLHGDTVYAVFPSTQSVKEWEQFVSINWTQNLATTPVSAHITGISVPANATRLTSSAATFDDFGNATLQVVSRQYGTLEKTVTTFDNRVGDWLIGLATQVKMTRTEPNNATTTRTVDHDFDALGRLTATHTEKNHSNPDLRLSVIRGLNKYGLQESSRVTTPDLPDQVTHTEYAPVFPNQPDEKVHVSRTWAEHNNPAFIPSSRQAVHPAHGMTVAAMDVNGVQVTQQFDDLGRLVRVDRDGQASASTSYANRPDTAGGSTGTVATTVRAGSTSKAASDALGRPLSTATTGFTGALNTATIGYDRLGRAVTHTSPAPSGTATTVYDSLDRVVSTVAPDGKVSTQTHGFYATASVDPTGVRTRSDYDPNGRLSASTRVLATAGQPDQELTTRYTYRPFDLLATVTDPRGNVTTNEYDISGRITRTTDPDTGVRTFSHFGTGDVDTQVHASSGNSTRFTYDDLGRVTAQISEDGTTTFQYDTAEHGIGRLASTLSPDDVRTEYLYTPYGQSAGLDQTDKSTNTTLRTRTTYDDLGRPATLSYPEGFTIRYGYNGAGHLSTISDVTNAQAPTQLWKVTARNADMSLDSALLGPLSVKNTYQPQTGRLLNRSVTNQAAAKVQDLTYGYRANGQVESRTDAVNRRGEVFGYDTLHRLTSWKLTPDQAASVTAGYTYDSIDNLTGVLRNGQSVEQRGYGKADGSQPHTLTSFTPVEGAGQTNTYDVEGRQVSGNGRSTTYTAFDVPRTVTRDGQVTSYAYNADKLKTKEISGQSTTHYLPGLYEKRTQSGVTTHVFHLSGSDGPIGQAVRTSTGTTIEYQLSDQLGSTTATVGADGKIGQTVFYEPFGAPIKADGSPSYGPTGNLTRGFTGHEHDKAVGLINMNGRVYDPQHRAFLTPDVLNPAGANPYAYVHQNPLNFTDPSGHTAKDGRKTWHDGQAQESFDEFAAAGEAYQNGGIAGLRDHELGALEKGLAKHDQLVDNRINELSDAVATANTLIQAIGGTEPELPSKYSEEADAAPRNEKIHQDAGNSREFLLALLAAYPDERLAELDGIGFSESEINVQDHLTLKQQIVAAAAGLLAPLGVLALLEVGPATLTACASNVNACRAVTATAAAIAGENGLPAASLERAVATEAAPVTQRSAQVLGEVVKDAAADVKIVQPAANYASKVIEGAVKSAAANPAKIADALPDTMPDMLRATDAVYEAAEALEAANKGTDVVKQIQAELSFRDAYKYLNWAEAVWDEYYKRNR